MSTLILTGNWGGRGPSALKEKTAGLRREYDRLMDGHSKAQVGG